MLNSGNALRSPEQLISRATPPSNDSCSALLASADRIIGVVRDTNATLIVQNDVGLVAKLSVFS